MREILFRGKSTETGKWREGCLLNVTLDGVTYNLVFGDDFARSGTGVTAMAHSCVYPETVGQFTGLTDKNGKKIFEGDVVAQNWYDHDEPADDSFGEVVFCEYDCSFSVMDVEKDGIVPLGRCHAHHWEAEVIGNIHDNPELLEG